MNYLKKSTINLGICRAFLHRSLVSVDTTETFEAVCIVRKHKVFVAPT